MKAESRLTKICFKCHEKKPLSEFYRHPRMADGYLNKCKKCAKIDMGTHRVANAERIREYDRNRPNKKERQEQNVIRNRRYRKEYPEKHLCHQLVMQAIKKGELIKQPCEVCGTDHRVDAHHDDYSKPLDVRWLCSVHHKQHHFAKYNYEEKPAEIITTRPSRQLSLPNATIGIRESENSSQVAL